MYILGPNTRMRNPVTAMVTNTLSMISRICNIIYTYKYERVKWRSIGSFRKTHLWLGVEEVVHRDADTAQEEEVVDGESNVLRLIVYRLKCEQKGCESRREDEYDDDDDDDDDNDDDDVDDDDDDDDEYDDDISRDEERKIIEREVQVMRDEHEKESEQSLI